jgi:hypothetical protein
MAAQLQGPAESGDAVTESSQSPLFDGPGGEPAAVVMDGEIQPAVLADEGHLGGSGVGVFSMGCTGYGCGGAGRSGDDADPALAADWAERRLRREVTALKKSGKEVVVLRSPVAVARAATSATEIGARQAKGIVGEGLVTVGEQLSDLRGLLGDRPVGVA